MLSGWRSILVVALVAAVACSDTDNTAGPVEICDNGVDDNGDGFADCADPECRKRLVSCQSADIGGGLDLAAKDGGGDGGTLPSISFQGVVKTMTLPTVGKTVGMDLTGDNKVDNRLGDLLSGINAIHPTLDLNADLAEMIATAELLLLQELRSRTVLNSPTARLQFFFGRDLDKNPKDNFSGKEWLGLNPKLPSAAPLTGSISKGQASFGPGDMAFPVALGQVYVVVTLKKARQTAKVSKSGMTNGILAGAVPLADVKGILLPGLATELTRQYHLPTLTPNGKKFIEYFDANKDGTVSVKELTTNTLIKSVILDQPDVDTDGDGKADAMSVGVNFTSVPCNIQKPE